MSTTPPASLPPSGDDRNLVEVDETYLAPSFEDKVQRVWEKNRGLIIAGCVVVLAVIVGKGGWALWQDRQDAALSAAYAEATDDAGLKAFASGHGGTELAGIAWLRLGDNAFTAGDFATARTHYEAARADLAGTPFISRISLALAVCDLKAGNTSGGQAALQSIADDATASPAIRAEAAYHLASLASAAGDRAKVTSLAERIGTIDPSSSWSQRAMILLSTMPVSANGGDAAKNDADSPAVSFPSAP